MDRSATELADEVLSCPRCRERSMEAMRMGYSPDGAIRLWWVCRNSERCRFPLDMPPHVYQVQMAPDATVSRPPNIDQLPRRFHHLYPLNLISDAQNTDPVPPSPALHSISPPTNGLANTVIVTEMRKMSRGFKARESKAKKPSPYYDPRTEEEKKQELKLLSKIKSVFDTNGTNSLDDEN